MRRPYTVSTVLTMAMYEDPNCVAQMWKELPAQAEAEATKVGLIPVKPGSWYAQVAYLKNKDDTFVTCHPTEADWVRLSAEILVEDTPEVPDAPSR